MYRISSLDPKQDRSGFRCGIGALDSYFRERVSQDIRRRIANCFVALDKQGHVAGFYTLAAAGMLLADLPESIARKMPRYPVVPVVRMGRLAVSEEACGQGLGGALLADALARSMDAEIAAFALVVDAKDHNAAAFYRHHGFQMFVTEPRSLFLPLATARGVRR